MLSVKTVLYVVAGVNLVHHLVGVLLQCRREYNNLVVQSHGLDELDAARPHEEEAFRSVLDIVDEGFVQVEHQSVALVLFMAFEGEKEGREDLGQIGEVVGEDGLLGGGDGRGLEDSEGIVTGESG